MRVLYYTIEDIDSGLFRTQVFDLLKNICRSKEDIEIVLLVVNRPWKILRHLYRIKNLAKNTGVKNLKLHYVPLLPPLRRALSYRWYSKLVTEWLTIIVRLFLFFSRRPVNIFHCRSYWPTLSLANLGLSPLIFDMRSLWVLENLSTGDLIEGSVAHGYWKNVETRCIEASEYHIGVSQAMLTYCSSLKIDLGKGRVIPISFDIDRFGRNESPLRRPLDAKCIDNFKKQFSTVFVYSGSLGQSGINMEALASLVKKLFAADKESGLIVLTGENNRTLSAFKGLIEGVDDRVVFLHPDMDDLGNLLRKVDIGVHALPKQLDSSTRLGTKVVEYWAAGLPVIVNEYVGAAASYIEQYGHGATISEDLNTKAIKEIIFELKGEDRRNIEKFAIEMFSTRTVLRHYLKLYQDCFPSRTDAAFKS